MRSFHRCTLAACALLLGLTSSAKDKDLLKTRQLQKARTEVWDAWCQTLTQQDTLPRMSLASLETGAVCQWTLPAALEPHAIMNFRSGTKGAKPEAGWPVYLYLHGSGPRESEWSTGWQLAKAFDDAPSFYVIPQIPNEAQYYRWWQQSKQWAWQHLLYQLLATSDVDPARLYIFGISEGGYGSQRLASYYADYLAGAAPMAGGEPLRNAPTENLCQTAFSLVTGDKDAGFYRNQLTQRTAERLDSLAAGTPGEYTHRVMLEPGKGHHITYSVSTPWLKEHNRKAQPRHFRWENFEMDGVKRNAFYNLEVLREETNDRYDYEMTLEGNTLHLEVNRVEYLITERDPHWGIELNHTRRYHPARHGKVRIYVSEELVRLDQPLSVHVNGKLMGHFPIQLRRSILCQSCQLFGDPLRLFPAAIEVEW